MRAVEYWRSRLSAKDAAVYDEMRDALSRHQDVCDLHIDSPDVVPTVFKYFLRDHPEMYWVSTKVSVSQAISKSPFSFPNSHSYSSFQGVFSSIYPRARMPMIDSAIKSILIDLQKLKGGSEEKMFEDIASYLKENVTYQINNKTNQNAANALVFHKAQCSGFAAAFKLIADSLDLWCITVSGEAAADPKRPAKREAHAWNIVRINNVYYHIDPTNHALANKGGGPLDRCFFGRSDDDFEATHTWDRNTAPICPITLKSAKSSPIIGNKSATVISSLYELRMLVRDHLQAGGAFDLDFELNIPGSEQKLLTLVKDCLSHCLSEIHRPGATISLSSRASSFHISYNL